MDKFCSPALNSEPQRGHRGAGQVTRAHDIVGPKLPP
jgi:hypothetical protein